MRVHKLFIQGRKLLAAIRYVLIQTSNSHQTYFDIDSEISRILYQTFACIFKSRNALDQEMLLKSFVLPLKLLRRMCNRQWIGVHKYNRHTNIRGCIKLKSSFLLIFEIYSFFENSKFFESMANLELELAHCHWGMYL